LQVSVLSGAPSVLQFVSIEELHDLLIVSAVRSDH